MFSPSVKFKLPAFMCVIGFLIVLTGCQAQGNNFQATESAVDETVVNNSASSTISNETESVLEDVTETEPLTSEEELVETTTPHKTEHMVSEPVVDNTIEEPTQPIVPEETIPTVVFTDVNEVVYAIASVNIRLGPGTEFDRIDFLSTGDSITRIGIGDNGWSKVLYNNQEAYISSNYLSITAPKPEPTSPAPSKQNFIPTGSYATPDFSIYNEYERAILQTVLSKINENKNNLDIHDEEIVFEQEISFESYYKIASFFYAYYGQKRAVDETFDFIRSSDVDENGNRIYYIRLRYDDIRKFESDMQSVKWTVDNILTGLENGSDEYILKQISEYLRTHISYTYGKYSIQNALLEGQSVCNGYALAFNMLANRAGIKSDLCIGKASNGEYHAWNRVILSDGSQYFYDITWYDGDSGPNNRYIHSSTNFHGFYSINNYTACWNGE